MRDLYDFILQREFSQPSITHEIERKSISSPARAALRLRFGRTDPIATYHRDRVSCAKSSIS